jgi:hypothetical protein
MHLGQADGRHPASVYRPCSASTGAALFGSMEVGQPHVTTLGRVAVQGFTSAKSGHDFAVSTAAR